MCLRWYENFVRFENLMGISFQKGRILWDFISHCEVWHVLGSMTTHNLSFLGEIRKTAIPIPQLNMLGYVRAVQECSNLSLRSRLMRLLRSIVLRTILFFCYFSLLLTNWEWKNLDATSLRLIWVCAKIQITEVGQIWLFFTHFA